MDKFKNLFINLDKTDLKIMKFGIKLCFGIYLFSGILLCSYLFFIHSIFLFDLGLCIFKLSTYIFIEFIICGVVADTIKKQME